MDIHPQIGAETLRAVNDSSERNTLLLPGRLGPLPPPLGAPVIQVRDLHTSYDGKPVLRGVNLEVYKGETVVIMGGSGCGKSTLLKHLIGAARPDSGEVRLLGKDISRLPAAELDEVRKEFGILFQSGALFNSMNVFDNVALPLRMHTDLDEEVIGITVKMKIRMVQLKPSDYEKMPAELSGGMKKRVGLARAIALDPKILFYDEPSAGLDPVVSAKIDELIMNLGTVMGVSSVVVTHEMDSAFRIADRMCMLHKGRVEFLGTPAEIRTSDNPLVQQFIHGRTDGPFTGSLGDDGYTEELLGFSEEEPS